MNMAFGFDLSYKGRKPLPFKRLLRLHFEGFDLVIRDGNPVRGSLNKATPRRF